MKKLAGYLEKLFGGKQPIRGIYIPPATTYELYDIYHGEQTETINGIVKKVLDKCGIKTKEEGVGWRVIR